MESVNKLLNKKRKMGQLYFRDYYPYYRQVKTGGFALSLPGTSNSGYYTTLMSTLDSLSNPPPIAARSKIVVVVGSSDKLYIYIIFNVGSSLNGFTYHFTPSLPYNGWQPTENRLVIYKTGIRFYTSSNVWTQVLTEDMFSGSIIYFTIRRAENDQWEFSLDDKKFFNLNRLVAQWFDLKDIVLQTGIEIQQELGLPMDISVTMEPKET